MEEYSSLISGALTLASIGGFVMAIKTFGFINTFIGSCFVGAALLIAILIFNIAIGYFYKKEILN